MQVIIIGAGQLGSRHLQGLSTSKNYIEVDVIDPSAASLETCKARFKEVAHANIKATFTPHLPKDKQYDVAIISTNSRIRAQVTEDLILNNTVKYIVFEKILFTLIDDYAHIQTLLNEHNIKAWVNCPRRMYPIYQELLEIFKDSSSIDFVFQGGDWGLGCNGIHFIDLVSHLNKEQNFVYINELLDTDIRESKRHSYKEFTGTLIAKGSTGSSVILTSRKNSTVPCIMQILSNDAMAIIDENRNLCTLYTLENEWKAQEIPFKMPYQSQLTGIVVDNIIDKGSCDLTTVDDSCILHIPFLNSLIGHLKKQGIATTECPIT